MQPPDFQISYNLATISNATYQFWQYANAFRIIAFKGEMGAGKTTFSAALAQHIGIRETLSSPTFTLISEYELPYDAAYPALHTLAHMDWYRLHNAAEAIDAGIESVLDNPHYRCWIEWYEKAPQIIPLPYLQVTIALGNSPEERHLSAAIISAH